MLPIFVYIYISLKQKEKDKIWNSLTKVIYILHWFCRLFIARLLLEILNFNLNSDITIHKSVCKENKHKPKSIFFHWMDKSIIIFEKLILNTILILLLIITHIWILIFISIQLVLLKSGIQNVSLSNTQFLFDTCENIIFIYIYFSVQREYKYCFPNS